MSILIQGVRKCTLSNTCDKRSVTQIFGFVSIAKLYQFVLNSFVEFRNPSLEMQKKCYVMEFNEKMINSKKQIVKPYMVINFLFSLDVTI